MASSNPDKALDTRLAAASAADSRVPLDVASVTEPSSKTDTLALRGEIEKTSVASKDRELFCLILLQLMNDALSLVPGSLVTFRLTL